MKRLIVSYYHIEPLLQTKYQTSTRAETYFAYATSDIRRHICHSSTTIVNMCCFSNVESANITFWYGIDGSALLYTRATFL